MSKGTVDLFLQLAKNDFGFFQKLQAVSSIMTTDVQMLTLDHTLEQAQQLFERGGFRHAPVEEDGEVVGIVSERDLVRHRPPLLGTAAERDADHRVLQRPVSQMMTRHPLAIAHDAPLEDALTILLDKHIDCLLVHDDAQQVIGIVTPTDFLSTIQLFHRVCTSTTDLVRFRLVDLDMSQGVPLDLIFSRGARSVRDVMTKDVVSVDREDLLGTAMECMQSIACRHLPVMSGRDRVLGMLTDRDILRALPLPVPQRNAKEDEGIFRQRLFRTLKGARPAAKVSALMTQEQVSVRPEALLVEAIGTMLDEGVSGLAVVDADEVLCGILTTTDILRVFRVVLQIGAKLTHASA